MTVSLSGRMVIVVEGMLMIQMIAHMHATTLAERDSSINVLTGEIKVAVLWPKCAEIYVCVFKLCNHCYSPTSV